VSDHNTLQSIKASTYRIEKVILEKDQVTQKFKNVASRWNLFGKAARRRRKHSPI
jgi:hypothetical protein